MAALGRISQPPRRVIGKLKLWRFQENPGPKFNWDYFPNSKRAKGGDEVPFGSICDTKTTYSEINSQIVTSQVLPHPPRARGPSAHEQCSEPHRFAIRGPVEGLRAATRLAPPLFGTSPSSPAPDEERCGAWQANTRDSCAPSPGSAASTFVSGARRERHFAIRRARAAAIFRGEAVRCSISGCCSRTALIAPIMGLLFARV